MTKEQVAAIRERAARTDIVLVHGKFYREDVGALLAYVGELDSALDATRDYAQKAKTERDALQRRAEALEGALRQCRALAHGITFRHRVEIVNTVDAALSPTLTPREK